jgi:multidrug efflux pump subunit AcrA (membrane-fusion protein)
MAHGKTGRTRSIVVGGLVVTGLAGSVGWLALGGRPSSAGTPTPTGVHTGSASVERTTIAERTQLTGSLGHVGSYTVTAPASGTLTRAPGIGQVVRQGQALYEVDGSPVILMYGQRPVWREMYWGMTDGPDVTQLQAALKAMGYGPDLTISDHFSQDTFFAICQWQEAVGLPVTGTVPLGQVVFLPHAIRITSQSVLLGASVQSDSTVEAGTSDQQAVIVQLPTADLPTTQVGNSVMILLPDGHTQIQGRVAAIGAAATSSTSSSDSTSSSGSSSTGSSTGDQSTAQVTITVKGSIPGFIDQAQVQVFISTQVAQGVLAVPIVALRALPTGEYQVAVVNGHQTQEVPVTVGLFDDIAGLAQVSGPGLAAGEHVEVPSGSA